MTRRARILALALVVAGCGGGAPTHTEVVQTRRETPVATVPAADPLAEPDVVLQPSASSIVTIRVVFHAGSADDPAGKEGATLLAASLMSEGDAGELSYAQRERLLFPMAAELGSQVSRDQTAFVGRVHVDHLTDFYGMFLDVIARPQMTETDFRRVLAQQKSALTLELRGNDDEELGKEVLEAMVYDGHPYGHPELGSEHGLDGMTRDDVVAQRTRVLCGGRVTIGLAGAIPDGFADRVKADVAAIGHDVCAGRAALPAAPERESRIWLVDKPDAASTAISMGMPIDVRRDSPDYPAMLLATAYFGQHRQFVGRLMQKMRNDRGLNYGDYAYTEAFAQDGWSTFPLPNVARRQQMFSIWLRPVKPENAHFAIRMAVRELREFAEHGMSDADFQRVRGYVTSFYALYLQTESRRLGFGIDDTFYGASPAWLDRLRDAWSRLTVDEVNAAVRRHVHPEHLQVAVITADAGGLKTALAAGTPSPIHYDATVSDAVLTEDREIVPYAVGIPAERITIVPVGETFR